MKHCLLKGDCLLSLHAPIDLLKNLGIMDQILYLWESYWVPHILFRLMHELYHLFHQFKHLWTKKDWWQHICIFELALRFWIKILWVLRNFHHNLNLLDNFQLMQNAYIDGNSRLHGIIHQYFWEKKQQYHFQTFTLALMFHLLSHLWTRNDHYQFF